MGASPSAKIVVGHLHAVPFRPLMRSHAPTRVYSKPDNPWNRKMNPRSASFSCISKTSRCGKDFVSFMLSIRIYESQFLVVRKYKCDMIYSMKLNTLFAGSDGFTMLKTIKSPNIAILSWRVGSGCCLLLATLLPLQPFTNGQLIGTQLINQT